MLGYLAQLGFDDSATLAVLLGVVQGLTEFIPVSSSGHLIVVSTLMNGEPLPLALNVALHFGTFIAVFAYFWRDWLGLGLAAKARLLHGERSFQSDTLLPALVLATIPAAVLGLAAEDAIEALFHNPASVALPLLAVGFILWYIDRRAPHDRALHHITIRQAVLIGIAQTFALIPGVSRSGATITAGRGLGFSREDAARFAFLLGTPVMAGAALLHLPDFIASSNQPTFYLGVIVSCVVGCLAIRFFLGFIKRFGFLAFAIYRALLACTIWWLAHGGAFQ